MASDYSQEFGDRHAFRSAAFLVLQEEGKILLYKRINTSHEAGNYSLVAGHLEGGETAQQAVAREAKEEANIDVLPEDLEVVHVLHNRSPEGLEYFNVFLKPKRWSGEIKNMEPERCGDLAWFPISALPENTIGYIRSVLGQIEMGVFYSNFGW